MTRLAEQQVLWRNFDSAFPFYPGQKIYEWDQSLDEVNVYIDLPSGVKAKQLACDILPNHLRVGIKGNPPYLDVRKLLVRILKRTRCHGCKSLYPPPASASCIGWHIESCIQTKIETFDPVAAETTERLSTCCL